MIRLAVELAADAGRDDRTPESADPGRGGREDFRTPTLRQIQPQRGSTRFGRLRASSRTYVSPTGALVGVLDRHVDVPAGRRAGAMQVAVDVDGPGRYLQQRYVR